MIKTTKGKKINDVQVNDVKNIKNKYKDVKNRHKWLDGMNDNSFYHCLDFFSKYGEYAEKGVEKNICEIIKELNATQKMIILGKLQRKFKEWNATSLVEIESAWALGAYQAFACEDYTCSLIYRYVEPKDMADILIYK